MYVYVPGPNYVHCMSSMCTQLCWLLYREELKRGCITSVLRDAITTSYVLRPRMGRVVYFEHEFGNVHKHAVTVNATWKDAKLR